MILGNEQSVDPKTKETIEDADSDNRKNLKAAGVNVVDRILGKGDIPHNKFMVLAQNDAPVAVLTGSTNWTSTGLCTQTNNALVIESADVAKRYMDYWNALKADVDAAHGDEKKLQSKTLRDFAHANNASSIAKPIDLGGGVEVEVMFSPNTPGKLTKNPDAPNDMQRVFDLINGAKQAVLFLAFDPGNNSILDAAGKALAKNPDLFVRGALTSPQRALNFSEALHQGGATERGDSDGDVGGHASHGGVTVVGEPGKPKKKGAKLPSSAQPDFARRARRRHHQGRRVRRVGNRTRQIRLRDHSQQDRGDRSVQRQLHGGDRIAQSRLPCLAQQRREHGDHQGASRARRGLCLPCARSLRPLCLAFPAQTASGYLRQAAGGRRQVAGALHRRAGPEISGAAVLAGGGGRR